MINDSHLVIANVRFGKLAVLSLTGICPTDVCLLHLRETIRCPVVFAPASGCETREAAEFYCSPIAGSRVEMAFVGDNGHSTFAVIDFSLGGVPYQILDACPHFTQSEAGLIKT